MKNKRIYGAFSLVEMMLLLLISSLMIAAGVTVVTKKHVKVPKLAVHGAYMCYMKNGQLHQEQYVGPGLTKKIKDENVGSCSFTPPERAAYLHIQAVGGGGGGGDAGYQGGDLVDHESPQEVISPFGITETLLSIKGMSVSDLEERGGTLYAYAQSEAAGDGGDVYYIKEDCRFCKKYRHWEMATSTDRNKNIKYDCSSAKTVRHSYTSYYNCNRDYCIATGSRTDTCPGGSTPDTNGNCPSGCYKQSSYWNGDKCYKDTYDSCGDTGTTTGISYTSGSQSCSYRNVTVPMTAAATIYTLKDGDKKRHETVAATGGAGGDSNMDYRKEIPTDQYTEYSVCNYGNTSKYTNSDGIFGSFFDGFDPVGVSCDTSSLMDAFGDDIYQLASGKAAITLLVKKHSKDIYGGLGLKYDKSEEGGADSYGKTCVADLDHIDGNGGSSQYTCDSNKYTTSSGTVTKSLYGDVSFSCTDDDSGNGSGTYGCSSETNYYYSYDKSKCTTSLQDQEGGECLEYSDECAYIPEKVSGSQGGRGINCVTAEVPAQLGLTYSGSSTIFPGVRGSDRNCTGAGYKSLYTEAEYNSQPGNCYAENGTDTTGAATVTIGSNSCSVNTPQNATQGKGARKLSTGANVPTAGSATNVKNATQEGNAGGNSVGENHVGYILKGLYSSGENAKYKYKFTWSTNYLQYGDGGEAGEYKAMIIRSFGRDPIAITLGQGGSAGAVGSGASGSNGTATIVGDYLTANGGQGGAGGLVTAPERLPAWHSGFSGTRGESGNAGQAAQVTNFKSNILNLVLPIDNTVLGRWLAASGRGGDGGGSENYCWAGVWGKWFEGAWLDSSIFEEDIACRNGTFWANTPAATSGMPGAVLIRW